MRFARPVARHRSEREEAGPSDDWGSADQPPSSPLQPGPVYRQDRLFYRVVAFTLAGAVLLALIGSFVLALYDKDVPESVVAIGSAAVGALAGVLVTGRS